MNITGTARMYSEYNKKNYSVKSQYTGAFYWTDALEDSGEAYGTNTNMANGTQDTIRNIPFNASRSWTGETSYVGSGAAHNVMQPYMAVYMWRRTA